MHGVALASVPCDASIRRDLNASARRDLNAATAAEGNHICYECDHGANREDHHYMLSNYQLPDGRAGRGINLTLSLSSYIPSTVLAAIEHELSRKPGTNTE
jgi:hypothetical protein